MKIATRLMLLAVFTTVVIFTAMACKDEEKSDCDKVCDHISGCCDWNGDDKSECKDQCKEMKDYYDADQFDAIVESMLDADCDSLAYYCYGYSY